MKILKKLLLIPLLAIGLTVGGGISQEVYAIDRYVTTYSDGSSIWLSSIRSNPAKRDFYIVTVKYVELRGRYDYETVSFQENNNKWYYNRGNGWESVKPNTSMNDILYYIMHL